MPTPGAAATAATAPGATATAATAVLEVDSGPRGAQVFVDGAHRGRTPLRLDGVAVGTHTLRLELRGYELVQAEKAIRAGYTESFFAALARRGSGRRGGVTRTGRDGGGTLRAEPAAQPTGADPLQSGATAEPDPPGDKSKSNPYLEHRPGAP